MYERLMVVLEGAPVDIGFNACLNVIGDLIAQTDPASQPMLVDFLQQVTATIQKDPSRVHLSDAAPGLH